MIKKGNVWGNFFSDIHLYKYQESTECNMNFKDLTFVKLSADCATKGTKDAVILMRSPGGKQGDKERRRKHSRDYKCSSRCNAQFIFILLIGFNKEKMAFGKKDKKDNVCWQSMESSR